ncbi:uncharacterized protein LOC144545058 [Carex rostrata]
MEVLAYSLIKIPIIHNNELHDAGEGSNNNTVMPSIGDPLLGFEDDSVMIDGFFEDEVNGYFNDDPDLIGSAESVLFINENGTGQISDGGMKNEPEEEMGSSSNSNVYGTWNDGLYLVCRVILRS